MSTVPQIEDLSEAPSRADDGDQFTAKADALLTDLQPFAEQANTLASFVNTKAGEAAGSAQSAGEYAAVAADKALAAEGAANTYDDTSEGIGNTSDGEYFTVPAADSSGYLSLYKNDGGTAALIRTSPSDQILTDAQAARDAAEASELAAQASLSAIQDQAAFYPDVASGIAGTVDGEFFRVLSADNTQVVLYRNDSNVESMIATFFTATGQQQAQHELEQRLRTDIVNLVKNPSEIPVRAAFFEGATGAFIDASSEGA